ncbi:MAG: hypothetical protein ACREF3_15630 [Acetobacteraceae bacterium]
MNTIRQPTRWKFSDTAAGVGAAATLDAGLPLPLIRPARATADKTLLFVTIGTITGGRDPAFHLVPGAAAPSPH